MECIHSQVSSAVKQITDCPVRPIGLESGVTRHALQCC